MRIGFIRLSNTLLHRVGILNTIFVGSNFGSGINWQI
jgi:hypothetical protein